MGKHQKKQKRRKEKKSKHERRKGRKNSTSSNSSSSADEWIEKEMTPKHNYESRKSSKFTENITNEKSKGEKQKRRRSSSSSGSVSSETKWVEKETITNERSTRKNAKYGRRSSSSSFSSEDQYTERHISEKCENKSATLPVHKEHTKSERDDWMSVATLLSSSSHLDRRQDKRNARQKEKESQQYDPRKNVRELNPYWKDGGDGLPSLSSKRKFARPVDDDGDYYKSTRSTSNWRKSDSSRYKKPEHNSDYKRNLQHSHENINRKHKSDIRESPEQKATATSSSDTNELELNEIAAKLIKAEILGQSELVSKLKEKLELARQNKKSTENAENNVMLVRTDSKGLTMPLQKPKEKSQQSKRKVDTHESSERSKYYADDGEYSLKEMFATAKFNSTTSDEKDFMASAMKSSKQSGNFDDVFVDRIRNSKNSDSVHRKMRDSAVADYERGMRVLDNCNRCIQNENMPKNLMISMGETVYLSLPSHEPLTEEHCLLVPIRHINCSTLLDENEWAEMMDFRKSLTKMFAAQGQDVIFYETMYAHSTSHMYITCIPVPKEQGDLAPIYFKKAIEESETEWSVNKKLINLAGKDVRKAVPKGLPYFFVSFGMSEGFAHIIEDKRDFPKYFASEVIGGILDIPHTIWRHPKQQDFNKQQSRVLSFSKNWSEYDCTRKT